MLVVSLTFTACAPVYVCLLPMYLRILVVPSVDETTGGYVNHHDLHMATECLSGDISCVQ